MRQRQASARLDEVRLRDSLETFENPFVVSRALRRLCHDDGQQEVATSTRQKRRIRIVLLGYDPPPSPRPPGLQTQWLWRRRLGVRLFGLSSLTGGAIGVRRHHNLPAASSQQETTADKKYKADARDHTGSSTAQIGKQEPPRFRSAASLSVLGVLAHRAHTGPTSGVPHPGTAGLRTGRKSVGWGHRCSFMTMALSLKSNRLAPAPRESANAHPHRTSPAGHRHR